MPTQPTTPLLTQAEAAEYLRIKPVTLAKLRKDRVGPAYVRMGSGEKCRVYYRQPDLDAWIESQTQRP